MSSATSVSIDATKCLITITHRIHFKNLNMPDAEYRLAVDIAKRMIQEKWGMPEFQFQLCTVKFRFEYVDGPVADADIKTFLAGEGMNFQQHTDPTRRQTGVWFPGSWGIGCTSAHEVGHELGMTDKYQSYDKDGNPVPDWVGHGAAAVPNPDAVRTAPKDGYSADGIGFTTKRSARVQQEDIDEIMAKLGVQCPCEFGIGDDAHHATPPVETPPPATPPVTPPVAPPTTEGIGGSAAPPADGISDHGDSTEEQDDWHETFDDETYFEPVNPDPQDDERPPTIYGEELGDDTVPLFFVPGIMGSSLAAINADGSHTRIWPVKKLNLTLKPLYPDGSRKAVVGLYPGIYDSLTEFIQRSRYRGGLGRTLGEDFFIYPYNWTQSNRDTGAQFRDTIVATLKACNARRASSGLPPWTSVDVVCHSMGGLVTRMAAALGAPVRRTVYMGTPHYGAPKAYFMLHPETESSLGLSFFENLIASSAWKLIGKDKEHDELDDALFELASSMQSVWELLPDSYYLSALGIVRVRYGGGREVEQRGVADTYLKGPWGFQANVDKLADAMDFKDSLGPTPPSPNLRIIQNELKTPLYVKFDRGTGTFEAPKARRAGDETVPEYSGRAGGSAVVVPGNHTQIPNDLLTHQQIRGFIPPGGH